MDSPDRVTAAHTRPTIWVLAMTEDPRRALRLGQEFDGTDIGVEHVDRVSELAHRTNFQHYDALIVDLDQRRKEALEAVCEIRTRESSRGQLPTLIVGLSSGDDALADLDAVERGMDEVIRSHTPEIDAPRRITRHLSLSAA